MFLDRCGKEKKKREARAFRGRSRVDVCARKARKRQRSKEEEKKRLDDGAVAFKKEKKKTTKTCLRCIRFTNSIPFDSGPFRMSALWAKLNSGWRCWRRNGCRPAAGVLCVWKRGRRSRPLAPSRSRASDERRRAAGIRKGGGTGRRRHYLPCVSQGGRVVCVSVQPSVTRRRNE